ncbi:hypothetical protein E9993_02610 [Labilibacter sediminis]|nr:hypothetical protein E9993_02610 [Labilibacter sediminis]
MKKSIAVSFLFLFMVAIASPVMATDSIQEPEKTEKTADKKCDKEGKKECCKKKCDKEKKAECKKECSKK